ncbi:type IVB pilus formation outer membrane protein, R64 PilN family [Acetobacter pasteurianus]|uniref:PilN n=1 Tax=Acetobacter pasteurianus NBRC 3278 TaxID=1226660 RepID=A0A401X6J1_ACEPA|nr:secretin N-terminal domain-containing protein [Acetobacter pasteurianus]GCD63552.1 PilN [Acetobacter pasteurianus NBRC 3278]GCD69970.1 PilN [Acetobacter pasteurianus NBRC 3280]GLH29012.1 type IVB pilus formation outer membrane protein, R64 PilN family [Acetobacter pasteurianus]
MRSLKQNLRQHFSTFLSVVLLSSSALTLTGCSGLYTVEQGNRASSATIKDSTEIMHNALRGGDDDSEASHYMQGAYVGTKVVRSEHGVPLPRRWLKPGAFKYNHPKAIPLYQIAALVTEQTHIPVTFAPEILDMAQGVTPKSGGSGSSGKGGGMMPTVSMAPNPVNNQGMNSLLSDMGMGGAITEEHQSPVTMSISNYSGSLDDFLSSVASHFSVSWEFDEGQIRFFRMITRTFTVHALPSANELNSAMNSGGSSSSGSSSGGQNAATTDTLSSKISIAVWDEITKTLGSIVSDYGRVSPTMSTGTITVSAPPSVMAEVERFLEGQNARLSKEIGISVELMALTFTDSDDTSVNLKGILDKASKYGLSYSSPTAAAVEGISSFTVSMTNPNSKFNASEAIASAVRTQARVRTRSMGTVLTLNGMPAPLQVAHTQSYVKDMQVSDSTTSSSDLSGTQRTQVNVDDLTTGFSMMVLPRITGDGDHVLLQFATNLSERTGSDNYGFDDYTTPDKSVSLMLKDVDYKDSVNQVRIPSGSTEVMAGFMQDANNTSASGVGSANFLGLGGSQVGKHVQTLYLVLVTPVIFSDAPKTITSDGDGKDEPALSY